MSTIKMHATTSATPEQYTAGLIDFGPGRSKIFGNSADSDLKVHDQGPGHADVTEGSGGVWERLRYDWSDPQHVVADDRLERMGRPVRPHLHVHAQRGRHDRHRLRRGARGKEPQGTIPRHRARQRRQEQAGEGVQQQRQGRRSPGRSGDGVAAMRLVRKRRRRRLAGAVGTAAMDCCCTQRYRRDGGKDGFWHWEFAGNVRAGTKRPRPGSSDARHCVK